MTDTILRNEVNMPGSFGNAVNREILQAKKAGENALELYKKTDKYLEKADRGGLFKDLFLKKAKNFINQATAAVRVFEGELRHVDLYIDFDEDAVCMNDQSVLNAFMQDQYKSARIDIRYLIGRIQRNLHLLNAYCR